ncbi:MAG: pepsin-like aspartyl protease [archaeon]|nr:pepsin-like aspartyl protease [archaeon]
MTKIFLFVLFLFNYTSPKEIIILPFRRTNEVSSNMNDTEIFLNLERKVYSVNIKAGSPNQNLILDIRTDEHISYIYSSNNCFDFEEPSDILGFSEKNSSTYKRGENFTKFNFKFKTANFFTDDFILGSSFINELCFILGIDMKNVTGLANHSGQLGLGIINELDEQGFKSNLIKNLKDKDIIESYDYFYEFDNDNSGRIIIGGEPNQFNSETYKNKMNKFSRLPNSGSNLIWGFLIDKIYYNKEEINGSFSYAQIKLEYGLIGVGSPIKEILDNNLFRNLLRKGICKEIITVNSTVNYVCEKNKVDKSKLGKLKIFNFEFEKTFEIDFSKLFMDIGTKTYFLVQFHKNSEIILGDYFIKNNLILFNQDKKQIGIYIEDGIIKTNSKGLLIVLIVLIVLASIIAVTLILMLVYKSTKVPRKKRETELLDDDYEYISK